MAFIEGVDGHTILELVNRIQQIFGGFSNVLSVMSLCKCGLVAQIDHLQGSRIHGYRQSQSSHSAESVKFYIVRDGQDSEVY